MYNNIFQVIKYYCIIPSQHFLVCPCFFWRFLDSRNVLFAVLGFRSFWVWLCCAQQNKPALLILQSWFYRLFTVGIFFFSVSHVGELKWWDVGAIVSIFPLPRALPSSVDFGFAKLILNPYKRRNQSYQGWVHSFLLNVELFITYCFSSKITSQLSFTVKV